MPFIDTTPPESADETVAAMYLRQQGTWGYIPNYAKVFCHRPEVLARWGALLAEIRRPMDKRRFELVTFTAAHALGNTACAMAHGKALSEFFTYEQICAIASGEADGILTDAEQAMVAYSRQVATDAQHASADQVAALRRNGLTDAEIFDVAATAAGRAFFTKLLDGLGVQLDSAFLKLDESFRRTMMVGRPIDQEPAVRIAEPQAEPQHVQP